MRKTALSFLAIVSSMAVPCIVMADPVDSFAIANVRVFDGHKTTERTNLIVQHGKIVAVTTASPPPA